MLFDLDGTLLTGASGERRFATWLLGRRAIGWRQGLSWLGYAARHARRDGRDVLRRDKGYVAGLAPAALVALAREHVDAVVAAGALDGNAVAAVARHRRSGDRLVLLSGTLQPLAEAYAEHLGIERAIGSLAPLDAERHVVGPPERHPYGPAKRELAERLRVEFGVARADTVAYADSYADRFLLEAVGEAIAVEPERALARLAAVRRWTILRHRTAMPRHASVPDPGGPG